VLVGRRLAGPAGMWRTPSPLVGRWLAGPAGMRDTPSPLVGRQLAGPAGMRRAPGVSRFPIPVPLTSGAVTRFKPFPVGVAHWTTLLTWSGPLTNVFSNFPNCGKFVKYKMPSSGAPKFS
jgi:hypothetical protein